MCTSFEPETLYRTITAPVFLSKNLKAYKEIQSDNKFQHTFFSFSLGKGELNPIQCWDI